MFTGLVEAVGELVESNPTSGGRRLRISSSLAPELAEGESLAVNGVCLTVVLTVGSEIHVDAGPETLRVTTLGALSRGGLVNLERPLRADGRLGGHFVQGHVDAVGQIVDLRPAAEFMWLTVSFPPQLAPYIVHKGSIAVDGISLTVAGLGDDQFDVQLVPFTVEHTNVKRAQIGDRVNLECDMVGKYVARAIEVAGAFGPRTGKIEGSG
jgi:riboflavin synthase